MCTDVVRFSSILRSSDHFLLGYDLPGGSKVWQEEPIDIHINLLHGWLGVSHVSESLWDCTQAHAQRQQPIHASVHLRVCHRHISLHLDPDELLEQSIVTVPNVNHQPIVLCHVYNRHPLCIVHLVSWIQHRWRRQYDFIAVWVLSHLHWCLSAQSFKSRP